MRLFRNPEVKKLIIIYFVFLILAVSAALFWNIYFAAYVFFIGLLGGILFLCFTKKRYDRLSRLSSQLDEILHGNDKMELIPDEEGELAVLNSKIYKMTIRLREQAENLRDDKRYLSEALADISHQIKTPLTSLHMLVPRLQGNEPEAEDRIRLVHKINGLLTKTDWLVTSLLKIAKLESGTARFKQDIVPVTELVKKAAEPLEVPMELKNQLLKIMVNEDIRYTGDILWSAEAVGNILKNCMEHTPEGGTLTVSAEENPVYTEIRIEDTGSGIWPEDLPHIFERFYRGNNANKESTGIGLAMSKMIIQKQNGTITVRNGETCGAQFHIRFYKGAI